MFRKVPLIRLCSMLALGLGAMVGAAPSALAECSCMCVDGAPYHVCTGFVSTQEQTPQCDAELECPTVDPTGTSEDPPPEDPPIATVEPPHPGLQCERRSVYRPDLGKYKKYKVCKPSADGDHRRDHKRHGENHEAWAARQERMQARWEAQLARHRARHGDDAGDS
jgi:hypothetical protein